MKFVSTRGGEKVTGAQAIVRGLSANGGLFVPEKFPQVSAEELEELLEADYEIGRASCRERVYAPV